MFVFYSAHVCFHSTLETETRQRPCVGWLYLIHTRVSASISFLEPHPPTDVEGVRHRMRPTPKASDTEIADFEVSPRNSPLVCMVIHEALDRG